MVLHTLPLLKFPADFPKSLILTAICPLEQMTEKEKIKDACLCNFKIQSTVYMKGIAIKTS